MRRVSGRIGFEKFVSFFPALMPRPSRKQWTSLVSGFTRSPAASGRYAITISRNWRITFGWDGDDAINVDMEDYHGR
jgi:hypothetical protein